VSVDTLGLVLRVLVTAANVGEREGGKRVLKRVKKMEQSVSRLTMIWVDGGFDGESFMQWVMDICRWTLASGAATGALQRFRVAQKTVGGGAHLRLADGVAAISQGLWVVSGNIGDVALPCYDSDHGPAIGVNFTPQNFSNILLVGYALALPPPFE